MYGTLVTEDQQGEDPWCGDAMPSYQSRAQRALAGEERVYDAEQMRQHIKLMVRGARMQGESTEDCETLAQKVEKITDDMRRGEHKPQYGYSEEDAEGEEDPLIVQVYDAACASVQRQPPDCRLPTREELKTAQEQDTAWRKRRAAVEKGSSEDEATEDWRLKNENDFAVQDGVLMKA